MAASTPSRPCRSYRGTQYSFARGGRPCLSAPKGRRNVATGGAQRNPWKPGERRVGRFFCLSFRPGGAADAPDANRVRRTRVFPGSFRGQDTVFSNAPMGLRKNRAWGWARAATHGLAHRGYYQTPRSGLKPKATTAKTEQRRTAEYRTRNSECRSDGGTRMLCVQDSTFLVRYSAVRLFPVPGTPSLSRAARRPEGRRHRSFSSAPTGRRRVATGGAQRNPWKPGERRVGRFFCLSFRPGGAADAPEANQARRTRHASPRRTVPSPFRGERKPVRAPRRLSTGFARGYPSCLRHSQGMDDGHNGAIGTRPNATERPNSRKTQRVEEQRVVKALGPKQTPPPETRSRWGGCPGRR